MSSTSTPFTTRSVIRSATSRLLVDSDPDEYLEQLARRATSAFGEPGRRSVKIRARHIITESGSNQLATARLQSSRASRTVLRCEFCLRLARNGPARRLVRRGREFDVLRL